MCKSSETLHGLPKGIQKGSRVAKFNFIGFTTGATLRRGDRVSHSLLRGCPKFKHLTPSIPLFILYLCTHFYSSNSWVPRVLQDRPPIHPFSWPSYLLTSLKVMPHHYNGLFQMPSILLLPLLYSLDKAFSLVDLSSWVCPAQLLEKNTQLADSSRFILHIRNHNWTFHTTGVSSVYAHFFTLWSGCFTPSSFLQSQSQMLMVHRASLRSK